MSDDLFAVQKYTECSWWQISYFQFTLNWIFWLWMSVVLPTVSGVIAVANNEVFFWTIVGMLILLYQKMRLCLKTKINVPVHIYFTSYAYYNGFFLCLLSVIYRLSVVLPYLSIFLHNSFHISIHIMICFISLHPKHVQKIIVKIDSILHVPFFK